MFRAAGAISLMATWESAGAPALMRSGDVEMTAVWHPQRLGQSVADKRKPSGRVASRPPQSGRVETRTGLRMMPTLDPPYHSVRRVFPDTAGRLACRTAPSRIWSA